jgi:hypothetical protein
VTSRAFLDANVLVQSRVRDVLLTLADLGTYAPLWSEGVLDEVRRHLPATMSAHDGEALFQAMRRAFPEATVVWPGVVDPGLHAVINTSDHHVIAAALWARADVLLTEDKRLTAESASLLYVQTPDVFAAYAISVDPTVAAVSLVDMARRRWLPTADNGSAVEILDRLIAWMHRHRWAATASMLIADAVQNAIREAFDDHLE